MICVIILCLCNEVWGMSGMFYVIARVYVMKFVTITQITPDTPQTSLHKHGTIT